MTYTRSCLLTAIRKLHSLGVRFASFVTLLLPSPPSTWSESDSGKLWLVSIPLSFFFFSVTLPGGGGRLQGCHGYLLHAVRCPAPPTLRHQRPSSSIDDEFNWLFSPLGEQHGFRQAKNIKFSLDGEFYFYSCVFNFDAPGIDVDVSCFIVIWFQEEIKGPWV